MGTDRDKRYGAEVPVIEEDEEGVEEMTARSRERCRL